MVSKYTETKLWKLLEEVMGDAWSAERVDNKVGDGTPDVNFSMDHGHGWIELKCALRPKSDEHPVKFPHFTGRQQRWIADRGWWAGNVFVFAGVGEELLLLPWYSAYAIGKLPYPALQATAVGYWPGREYLDRETLTEALSWHTR